MTIVSGEKSPSDTPKIKKNKKLGSVKWWLPRFTHWLFGYIMPLYVVIGSLCFIAAPGLFGSEVKSPDIGKVAPHPAPAAKQGAETTGDLKVVDMVRLTLESSKDRFESIKEGHDKLFSLIAALAALLAFFGFKGVETYNATKAKAEETLASADEAVATANEANDLAKKSIKDLENFVQNLYSKGATAEINVAQGLVLKEIAELYRELTMGPHTVVQMQLGATTQQLLNKYHSYLNESLGYFDRVTDKPEGVDSKVVARALIFRATILKKLGRLEEALKNASLAQSQFAGHEYAAYYNAACYCCLLSAQALSKLDPAAASEFEHESINHLAKSIELDASLKQSAAHDDDFQHFRTSNNTRYLALISVT